MSESTIDAMQLIAPGAKLRVQQIYEVMLSDYIQLPPGRTLDDIESVWASDTELSVQWENRAESTCYSTARKSAFTSKSMSDIEQTDMCWDVMDESLEKERLKTQRAYIDPLPETQSGDSDE